MLLKKGTFEFTRSANTTAYASDEVVSNGSIETISFGTGANALIAGGQYMIKKASLTSNSSGTTNASFDLYLYTSGITSTISMTDNAPFNVNYGDKHIRIGKTSFTLTNPSGNSDSKEDINVDVNLPFIATGQFIYGVLVATSAYTPASGEKFYGTIELITINV